MIKLIVSDIDGTLVPEGTNDVNPEIFSLIRSLRSRGVYFAVASGRHKCSIEKLFAPIRDDIIYITSNGAYTGTYSKTRAEFPLSEDIYTSLFQDFDTAIGYPYFAETANGAYTSCPDPEFSRLLTEDYGYDIQFRPSLLDLPEKIIKLSLYHPENAQNIDEKWLKKWNKICRCAVSGTHWIDFMATDVNKGNALFRLQEILNVTIHETLAFGDQANDIEMLKQAYFSFAMGNANCTVKNAARFTCDSCYNDGVLKTIRGFFPHD